MFGWREGLYIGSYNNTFATNTKAEGKSVVFYTVFLSSSKIVVFLILFLNYSPIQVG